MWVTTSVSPILLASGLPAIPARLHGCARSPEPAGTWRDLNARMSEHPPSSLPRRRVPDSGPLRAAIILGRAAVRRCPNCGGAGIFRSYLRQRPTCPRCGLRLDRGQTDFFIGAYTINLIVAEIIVFFGGLAAILFTWPDVPWALVMWGLVGLMVVSPIVLYPVSRQFWLAVDLIFRPAEEVDYGSRRES
jgi:uncharacterized protein (DUF983 family)